MSRQKAIAVLESLTKLDIDDGFAADSIIIGDLSMPIGAVADGYFLKRVGNTVVGAAVIDGAVPDPLELNVAMFADYVAVGASPATTGAIRLESNAFVMAYSELATSDRVVIGWDDGNNAIVVGDTNDPDLVSGDPGSMDLGSVDNYWSHVWAHTYYVRDYIKPLTDLSAALGQFNHRFSELWADIPNSDPGVQGGFYYKTFSNLQPTDRVAVVSAG